MTTAQANEVAGFDIDSLDSGEQVTHYVTVIKDAAGNPVSGFIRADKNSPQYQDAMHKIRVGNIQRAANRQEAIDTKTEEGADIVARQVKANDTMIALSVVIGWFGFRKGQEAIIFDKALLEKMFQKKPQWQALVLADLEAESNF